MESAADAAAAAEAGAEALVAATAAEDELRTPALPDVGPDVVPAAAEAARPAAVPLEAAAGHSAADISSRSRGRAARLLSAAGCLRPGGGLPRLLDLRREPVEMRQGRIAAQIAARRRVTLVTHKAMVDTEIQHTTHCTQELAHRGASALVSARKESPV